MPTIKVPEPTLSDVKHLAEAMGRSPHWVMLEAIKKYVEEQKQAAEAEKAWLEAGVAALENAEEHGYATSADELNAKIQQLKNNDWATKA